MRVNQTGNNPVQGAETRPTKHTTHTKGAEGAKGTSHTRKTEGAEGAGATDGASSTISSKAREYSRAKELATNAPDVREERIAELKRRIADGKYHVDPDAIADRMVDEHLTTKIG